MPPLPIYYLLLFNLVAKRQLFLSRKILGGRASPPPQVTPMHTLTVNDPGMHEYKNSNADFNSNHSDLSLECPNSDN